MATENQMMRDGSKSAATDMSNTGGLSGPGGSGQFLAVKWSTSTDLTVVLANAGGERIYGILQNKPKASQAADVCFAGVSKAVAGAAITTGALLMTDTSGRLITQTGSNKVVAVAHQAASGVGAVIEVLVLPQGTVP